MEIKRKHILRFSNWLRLFTFGTIVCLLLSYTAPFIHPNTLKIIPFFGLAYPIFITINLILLVFWAVFKKRTALYVLIAILIGIPFHFRTLPLFPESNAPTEGKEIWRILSYNVRLFDVYNEDLKARNESRMNIIQYVKDKNPDVVCFQEFFHQDKPSVFPTRDALIEELDAKYYHERYSHKIHNRQNFGICMLSKYPIIAKGDVMFDNASNSDNYCIFADVVKGKDTLRIYNVHLQSIKLQQQDYALFGQKNAQAGSDKSTIRLLIEKLTIAYPARANQAIRVMEHMKTSPYPVIVCGDFNDTPMSYVYAQFNRELVDAFRETSRGLGVTYVGKVPAGRIDYIFHDSQLKARKFTIQQATFSDHRAVSCEIWKE